MFDNLDDVIEAFGRGEIIVVTDDENRENEGDLIVAADRVTDEAINFMTKFGRGLICVALPPERLRTLGLSRMATRNQGDAFGTAFMDSVDAAEGITTGISANDRARTVQVLVDPSSTSDDIVCPGHMFPLESKRGGVLVRAGHTESAVDLSRLAGLREGGVICEILREDGTMMRLDELREFATHHGLLMTSVADLIAHRRRTEHLVSFVRSIRFPTEFGEFELRLYESILEGDHHVALVMGDVTTEAPVMVRVHSECLTGDVFHSRRCDCGHQLHRAMELIGQEGRGVLLYMRQEGRGIGLANKIHAYQLQDDGMDTVEANEHLGFEADLRDYGVGAQILAELGLNSIRLLTNNPRKIVGLEGHGLKIVERVPLVVEPSADNERYLRTKQMRLGHLLDLDARGIGENEVPRVGPPRASNTATTKESKNGDA